MGLVLKGRGEDCLPTGLEVGMTYARARCCVAPPRDSLKPTVLRWISLTASPVQHGEGEMTGLGVGHRCSRETCVVTAKDSVSAMA